MSTVLFIIILVIVVGNYLLELLLSCLNLKNAKKDVPPELSDISLRALPRKH